MAKLKDAFKFHVIGPSESLDTQAWREIISLSFGAQSRNAETVRPSENGHNFVLKRDGRVIGVATLNIKDDFWVLAHNIAIHPDARGKNNGLVLMDKIEEMAGKLGKKGIALSASETSAAFYERRGYRLADTVPDAARFYLKNLQNG